MTDDEFVEMMGATIDPTAWSEEANLAYRIAQGLGAPTQDTVYEWTPRRMVAREKARNILARIRRPLQAQGIEMAADVCAGYADAVKPRIVAADLRSFARRYGEGEQ